MTNTLSNGTPQNPHQYHPGTLRADLIIYYRYYPTPWGQEPNLDHIDDEGAWWIWSCCGQQHDVAGCQPCNASK
ncbi:MAG: hypothetical protein AAGF95_28990 [Chloroflexota bacterium]